MSVCTYIILIFTSVVFYFYTRYNPKFPMLDIVGVDLGDVILDNTTAPYFYNVTIYFKISNPIITFA